MRRILLALLICLLPLQSFAGLVISTKMATSTTNAAQAPCHEASQADAPASQDCCGLQGACYALCHIVIAPMTVLVVPNAAPVTDSPSANTAAFQSVDARLGFKPPLL